MKNEVKESNLSRRERQIMEVIYKKKQASVAEVLEGLTDPPSYSAVRALLNILVDKGNLNYAKQGLKYIYKPVTAKKNAGKVALKSVLDTFFEGSLTGAVSGFLGDPKLKINKTELEKLEDMIAAAKKQSK